MEREGQEGEKDIELEAQRCRVPDAFRELRVAGTAGDIWWSLHGPSLAWILRSVLKVCESQLR